MDRLSQRFAARSSKARRSEWGGKISLKPDFCIGFALLLLVFPLRWLTAWVVAAAFHELCHWAMIRLLGYRVLSVTLGFGGATMETEAMRRRDEFLCAMSGPVGALSLLLVARWFPRLAVCVCLQTMYNALPVYPLDGGRAVSCLIHRYVPSPWDDTVEGLVGNGVLLTIGLLGAAATFLLRLGPIPILCALILFLKNRKAKIPCKAAKERVQ